MDKHIPQIVNMESRKIAQTNKSIVYYYDSAWITSAPYLPLSSRASIRSKQSRNGNVNSNKPRPAIKGTFQIHHALSGDRKHHITSGIQHVCENETNHRLQASTSSLQTTVNDFSHSGFNASFTSWNVSFNITEINH